MASWPKETRGGDTTQRKPAQVGCPGMCGVGHKENFGTHQRAGGEKTLDQGMEGSAMCSLRDFLLGLSKIHFSPLTGS